ncbi:hypothetical protein [Fictibacillus sp. BK138]|uniref:hypothetical protein n=1 Tax=Fictibacillus sp. BK138 TaxID=2512121 RepID=UPI001028B7DE|nr:hypothetical protein [Fictibacillus sp. BK138]RZT21375.1 hypothetical protein EV282_0437 [Fictibacillus sp. BK138]
MVINTGLANLNRYNLNFIIIFFYYAAIYGTIAVFEENMMIRSIKDIILLVISFITLFIIIFKKQQKDLFVLFVLFLFYIPIIIIPYMFLNLSEQSLLYGLKITILPIVMLFTGILLSNFIKKDKILNCFKGIFFIITATWLIQYFLGIEKLLNFGYEYGINVKHFYGYLRLPSTIGTPDGYAILLAFLSIIIERNIKNKKIKILFFIVSMVFILSSTIRSAIMYWLVAYITLFFLRVLTSRTKFIIYSSLLLIFVPIFLFIMSKVNNSLFSIHSLEDRLSHWNLIEFDPFSTKGIIGSGLGSVGASSVKLEEINRSLNGYAVDNQFLAIYYQIGILGIIIFLLIIFYILYVFFKKRSKGQLGIIIIIGTIVSCLFTNTLEIYPYNLYFWFYLGILIDEPELIETEY